MISLGTGNVAMNTGNNSQVWAFGRFSRASNLGGSGVLVQTSGTGTASWAFNVLGSGNIVQTDKAPLAIVGSLFQTNATVQQLGTGTNINGTSSAAPPPPPPRLIAHHGHGPGGRQDGSTPLKASGVISCSMVGTSSLTVGWMCMVRDIAV